MKFEREKDIEAFRNKTRDERRTLRREARRRDPTIVWLAVLGGGLTGAWFPISRWLLSLLIPHPGFLLSSLVYFAIGVPFYVAFYSLFITPRIRRALNAHDRNVA